MKLLFNEYGEIIISALCFAGGIATFYLVNNTTFTNFIATIIAEF